MTNLSGLSREPNRRSLAHENWPLRRLTPVEVVWRSGDPPVHYRPRPPTPGSQNRRCARSQRQRVGFANFSWLSVRTKLLVLYFVTPLLPDLRKFYGRFLVNKNAAMTGRQFRVQHGKIGRQAAYLPDRCLRDGVGGRNGNSRLLAALIERSPGRRQRISAGLARKNNFLAPNNKP